MTKFSLFLFPLFFLLNSPSYSSTGALETAGVEKGNVSTVDHGTGPAEFANGEDPGRPTASKGTSTSTSVFSGYPKTFIIPKGVCEQGGEVIVIGE